MLALLDGQPDPVAAVYDRVLETETQAVPVRVYRSRNDIDSMPMVVWFHAGGGVIGDLDSADRTCRRLANRTEAVVVSVDYRRAPEHRFPAAVDDCWAATRWLAQHGGGIDGEPNPIAVGGDSMGGNFAAVVAQLAATTPQVALRHPLLVYPFPHLTLAHESVDTYG